MTNVYAGSIGDNRSYALYSMYTLSMGPINITSDATGGIVLGYLILPCDSRVMSVTVTSTASSADFRINEDGGLLKTLPSTAYVVVSGNLVVKGGGLTATFDATKRDRLVGQSLGFQITTTDASHTVSGLIVTTVFLAQGHINADSAND